MLHVIDDYLTFIALLPTLPNDAVIVELYTRMDNEPMKYITRVECAKMDSKRYHAFTTQFVFPVRVYATCDDGMRAGGFTRGSKWCDGVGCTAHHPSTPPEGFTHYEETLKTF